MPPAPDNPADIHFIRLKCLDNYMVLSDGRCSVNDPVEILFLRHDEWFPQAMIFDFRCAPSDLTEESSRSPNRFHPVTLFFIRGSALPSVGLPRSQHPSVRHGVSDVPASHRRIPGT